MTAGGRERHEIVDGPLRSPDDRPLSAGFDGNLFDAAGPPSPSEPLGRTRLPRHPWAPAHPARASGAVQRASGRGRGVIVVATLMVVSASAGAFALGRDTGTHASAPAARRQTHSHLDADNAKSQAVLHRTRRAAVPAVRLTVTTPEPGRPSRHRALPTSRPAGRRRAPARPRHRRALRAASQQGRQQQANRDTSTAPAAANTAAAPATTAAPALAAPTQPTTTPAKAVQRSATGSKPANTSGGEFGFER
jgi:hypothetical protein